MRKSSKLFLSMKTSLSFKDCSKRKNNAQKKKTTYFGLKTTQCQIVTVLFCFNKLNSENLGLFTL